MDKNSENVIKSLSDIFEKMDNLPEGELKDSIQKIISKKHEIDQQTNELIKKQIDDNEEIHNNKSF